jgi:hypothetical protein
MLLEAKSRAQLNLPRRRIGRRLTKERKGLPRLWTINVRDLHHILGVEYIEGLD